MSNIKKTCARVNKGNDFITNVISANQRFSLRIFKFQRRSCKLSFLFPSHRQRTQESLSSSMYWQRYIKKEPQPLEALEV